MWTLLQYDHMQHSKFYHLSLFHR